MMQAILTNITKSYAFDGNLAGVARLVRVQGPQRPPPHPPGPRLTDARGLAVRHVLGRAGC